MGNLEQKRKIGNLDDKRMPYDYGNREYGTVPPDTGREPFRWVSEIAYKNVHRIVARGYDTTELVEEGYGAADMLFVDFQARIPLIEEEKMLNYVMILALEDGLSMPAALSRIVDLDMLGATGAVMMDMGFSPEATWAILAVTRSFAAGAHYIEEVEREEYTRLGQTLTPREDYDGPADRPVPPLGKRDKVAKPAQTHTPEEWKEAFLERQKVYGSGYGISEEIKDPSKKTGVKSVGK